MPIGIATERTCESVEDLYEFVQKLHDGNAKHKRRGFGLKEASLAVISNHLIEENVEFQAELLSGDQIKQLAEAADVIGAFLHAIYAAGLPLDVVVRAAEMGLRTNFTFDEREIETNTPGFTRQNRRNCDDSPEW